MGYLGLVKLALPDLRWCSLVMLDVSEFAGKSKNAKSLTATTGTDITSFVKGRVRFAGHGNGILILESFSANMLEFSESECRMLR